MSGNDVASVRAALNIPFGAAIWLAFFIHAVGVEFYVSPLHFFALPFRIVASSR